MNPKQRLRRFNIQMTLVMLGPLMLLVTLALLAIELNWPVWWQYVLYGLMFLSIPVTSRIAKRGTDALIHELPIRDDSVSFDPDHPTVSAAERQRYNRAVRYTGGRKGLALQLGPMGAIFLVLFGSPYLSPELEWISTHVVFGVFFAGIERSLAFEKRVRSRAIHLAGYKPRWWTLYSIALTLAQWCLWAGFIAIVIVTVTGIYWPAAPFVVGGIAGWFVARYGFNQIEHHVFSERATN